MLIHSLCNTCFQRYELRMEPKDIPLLRQLTGNDYSVVPCPRLCGGMLNVVHSAQIKKLVQDPRLKEPLPITVQELFKAVKGGGLPDEIPKSYELAVSLFKAHPVKSVFMEQDGKDIYLHEVRFENGSIIHLAHGARGAKVLKITRGPV